MVERQFQVVERQTQVAERRSGPFRPIPAEFNHWSVCVSVRNFHAKYLGTKRFRGSCTIADAHGASIDDVIDDVA